VPVHCDLRDDPPKVNDGSEKPQGAYLDKDAHSDLETLWEKAVNSIAITEEIIPQTLIDEVGQSTDYCQDVKLDLADCKKGGKIKFPTIAKGDLMNFMINVCLDSKNRCQKLFHIDNPQQRNDNILAEMTREIFTACVADLIAVWRYIWTYCQVD